MSPRPNAVRVLVISTVLQLGFSVGLQHMLTLLGAFNVQSQIHMGGLYFECIQSYTVHTVSSVLLLLCIFIDTDLILCMHRFVIRLCSC